jgi:ElaB/YqjD/DUF883 family membrane-anchored ribosome-binding protein
VGTLYSSPAEKPISRQTSLFRTVVIAARLGLIGLIKRMAKFYLSHLILLIKRKKETYMETNLSSGVTDNSSNPVGGDGKANESVYKDATSASQQSGSNLRSELTSLKSDLDSLMSRASTLTDRELSEARDRLMNKFSSVRETAKGMATEASKQLSSGVDATSEYVKERPLQAVAIATGIGLLLGALLRRN